MKKLGYLFIAIISFVGVNKVSALTWYQSSMPSFYRHYEYWDTLTNEHPQVISNLVNYWETNWSSSFDYYLIGCTSITSGLTEPDYVWIVPTNSNNIYSSYSSVGSQNNNMSLIFDNNSSYSQAYIYRPSSNIYEYLDGESYQTSIYAGSWSLFYSSNTTLYYKASSPSNSYPTNGMIIPSYSNTNLDLSYQSYNINPDDIVPTYTSLTNPTLNYTEINLNDYEYIILSLKNYNVSEDFISKMYQKGQVCSTTLYDYGLEEKKNYISGYETQACSVYYNELTTIQSNIRVEDVNHHSVYYLSAYDKTKENTIYIDPNVYDITYITSENVDNPTIVVNGSTYSTLPYSSLSDSAILTYENGYSDTWTCAKYDSDCIFKSTGLSIDEIFSHPIQSLKTVWGAINSMLTLIATFIGLLPPTLQAFLYMSFALAIILGIIKIIL